MFVIAQTKFLLEDLRAKCERKEQYPREAILNFWWMARDNLVRDDQQYEIVGLAIPLGVPETVGKKTWQRLHSCRHTAWALAILPYYIQSKMPSDCKMHYSFMHYQERKNAANCSCEIPSVFKWILISDILKWIQCVSQNWSNTVVKYLMALKSSFSPLCVSPLQTRAVS